MIKKSLAAIALSLCSCTTGEKIVSAPMDMPILELTENEQIAPVLEEVVNEQKQTPEVEKAEFPLQLGTYNYDIYKGIFGLGVKIGSSQIVFDNYSAQGSFAGEYVRKTIEDVLKGKVQNNLYYLKFSTETILGSLALQQSYETIAFIDGKKVKPLVEFASGEEDYTKLFYQSERKIHKLGAGEITLSQEEFDKTCDPLTLLVRLMSTRAKNSTRTINLCNFYAKELEQVNINVVKEGENFCGTTSLPPGVFLFSEQVEMKFYYFQKKGKLYPVMNYELHVRPNGFGWFVFKFTEFEKK